MFIIPQGIVEMQFMTDKLRGYFCFFALNLRQGMPDALFTAADGISLDLKSIILHPRGNLSSQVMKKWMQSKQLILSFFIATDMPVFPMTGAIPVTV